MLPDDPAQGGAQQLTPGPVRAGPALASTLGLQRRFAQGAVVGNHPLPASPTPFHYMGEEQFHSAVDSYLLLTACYLFLGFSIALLGTE